MRLENKVALITGAASGMGRAAAELFAAEGAKVVMVGRRQAQGDEVAGVIRAKGGDATTPRRSRSNVRAGLSI